MSTPNALIHLSPSVLWQSATPSRDRCSPQTWAVLPTAAHTYLSHAIAPDTPLATAIRLHMRGEIKLEQRWHPFRAQQVIHWPRGMIWQATAWVKGLPVRGSDRFIDGEGVMDWRLLGLFPVVTASGPDISHSGLDRVLAELVWLPSVLCRSDVTWTGISDRQAIAHLDLCNHPTDLVLTIAPSGRLEAVQLSRWGNPGGGEFCNRDFGGLVEAEACFAGYTIPTRLRVGWYLGSDRFASEGEFFRVTVTTAEFR